MTGDTPASLPPTDLTDRAALRAMRESRRRVWRSILTVVVVTLGMIVVLILNRDHQAVRSCRTRMEYAVQELQKRYDNGEHSPLELPLPQDVGDAGDGRREIERLRRHVYYNVLHAARISFAREVGVCCCRQPHTRLLLPDGRHVIIFNVERGTYELCWLDETEFARRAGELELRVPIAP
jgi:hypothetical protein